MVWCGARNGRWRKRPVPPLSNPAMLWILVVKDEAELEVVEEHLLWCGACVDRAEAVAQYVDAVRAAACDSAE
jgi:hypothetical protein